MHDPLGGTGEVHHPSPKTNLNPNANPNPNRTSGGELLHYRRPSDPSKSYGSMSRDTLKCVFSTSVRINKVAQLSSQYVTYLLSTVSSREISLKTSLTLSHPGFVYIPHVS